MIWKDDYEIGVELVDKQHKELFKRLGDFIQTVRSDEEKEKKKEEVEKTLNFMGEYVTTHFDAEEALHWLNLFISCFIYLSPSPLSSDSVHLLPSLQTLHPLLASSGMTTLW